MLLALLLACAPIEADACLRSFGDTCRCEPQCLTEQQIALVQSAPTCDRACGVDTADPGWTCAEEDGVCVVIED